MKPLVILLSVGYHFDYLQVMRYVSHEVESLFKEISLKS